ncbi:MAG: family 16 glycoside hydrolase [Deltaproteobacteria bacterium]
MQPAWKAGLRSQGFIRRLGNGNNWRNVTGYHRPGDVETPTGEWNTLECTCQGDRIRIVLNGKLVNEAVNVKPSRGKISLQSFRDST